MIEMSAFSEAWSLIKMPIVPNSLTQRKKSRVTGKPLKSPYRVWDADFQDPITEKIKPFTAYEDEEGIFANIDGKAATVRVEPEYNRNYSVPEEGYGNGLATHESLRRRGYATALYDALAVILANQNKNLVPSDFQSEEGGRFWGDKRKWPVRDDL